MKLLEVKDLKAYFDISAGCIKAVDGVSFDVDYGEALGLVGESGCGKTTSALAIAKLLPKEGRVHSGQILLENMDLAAMDDREIRKHRWNDVSIVFQGAMNSLNPVLKIGDQIAEAIVLHRKVDKKAAMKRAGELLELVEIPADRLTNYPHEFSGGMKQRVMIAMALACDPKVVIGDEPTTALDVMVQAQILELLERLRRELNMGFILITHDLSILAETCDRIAVMYGGKIMEMGSVTDIFERTLHPYTKALIAAFPDVTGKKNLSDGIRGEPPNMLHPPSGCLFHPRCDIAGDLCREEAPCQREVSDGHFISCHNLEVRQ